MLKIAALILVAGASLCLHAGCGRTDDDAASEPDANLPIDADSPIVMDALPPIIGGDHDHSEHGPHGGELIELGKEDFHAELLHGSEGVAVYLLDATASGEVSTSADKLSISLKHDGQVKAFELNAAVSTSADKLSISLKHDGQVKAFELNAAPDRGGQDAEATRFASSDKQIDEWLDAGAEGAIVVQIEGRSYTGKITHREGHEH
jgi:hypothetical protein